MKVELNLFPIYLIAQILLIIAKVTGYLNLNWIIIFIPTIVPIAVLIVVISIFLFVVFNSLIFAAIKDFFTRKRYKK